MKYGIVSIVGKPNVGKSTLLNNILCRDAVISTEKPQTTRNLIEISYKDEDSLINFLDTPGLHTPKNKLDLFLNSQVKSGLKKSDIVLFLFDISRDLDDEDLECIKVLKDFHVDNAILVINKIDKSTEEEMNKIQEKMKELHDFRNVIKISGQDKKEAKRLVEFIKENISTYEGDKEDLKLLERDISDKFLVSETIREIILKNFRKEIPYGVAITIDEFKYEKEKNLLVIKYSIIVEKESQKPIIIGKNAKSMKNINITLREKLNNFFDCKIFTTSEVKVKKDWRNDDLKIKELGYRK